MIFFSREPEFTKVRIAGWYFKCLFLNICVFLWVYSCNGIMHAVMKHKFSFISFRKALNFCSVLSSSHEMTIDSQNSQHLWMLSGDLPRTGQDNISLWKVFGFISLHHFQGFNNSVLSPKKQYLGNKSIWIFSNHKETSEYIMHG